MGTLSPVHWLLTMAAAVALNIVLPIYGIVIALRRREARQPAGGWLIGSLIWAAYVCALVIVAFVARGPHPMSIPLVGMAIAWVWLCLDANRRASQPSP